MPPGLQAEGSPGADAAIKARERALLPVYHQVAIQFAQVRQGWWANACVHRGGGVV